MLGQKCRIAAAMWTVGAILGQYLCAATPQQPPAQPSYEIRLLAEHGVTPDAAGIARYLGTLFPSETLKREIDQLIVQLGSDDFREREAASRKLAAIGGAQEALMLATRNTDAEVSHRARRLLEQNEQWRESVLLAVLRCIHKEKLTGLTPQLLPLLPICGKEHLRRAATEAVIATAGPNDAALLRSSIQSPHLEVRAAAIVALERVLKEEAVAPLRPLLKSKDPTTRLAAVEALVNRLPAECLGVLVGLLEADEAPLRARSAHMLRALTGQQFGSIQSAVTPEARREIATKWRRWADGPGRSAELKVPVSLSAARLGRVLVCVQQSSGPEGMVPKLVEFNEQWQVKELRGGHQTLPFGCFGQLDGHRLYTDWRSHTVIELDENGKGIWEKQLANVSSVERLENGNLLLALYQNRQVVEMDRNWKQVWQINVNGIATDAHQLENGNVLVALFDQGIVAELDRAGQTVWQVTQLPNPWSARRLPGGNTIVSCSGSSRVLEIGPDKRIIRTLENIPSCFDADMLENGNLLVGYQNGLREIDPAGQTVRELPIGQVRRLSIY